MTFIPTKSRKAHEAGKTDARMVLNLPETVASLIRETWTANPKQKLLCPKLFAIKRRNGALGPRFREIFKLAGVQFTITPPRGNKGIHKCSHSFHSLRHTLSTELKADGVSEKTNLYVTGHQDLKSKRGYIHERPEPVFDECRPTFDRILKVL